MLTPEEREQIKQQVINKCRCDLPDNFNLSDHKTDWALTDDVKSLDEDLIKKQAKKYLKKNMSALSSAQELLYASNKHSVLLIFQASDAAGKDSTIKHVISGVNPQGCQVHSFKKPSSEDLDHHFLWRYQKRLPERGHIGIFNRSYYEEVLVVKVHQNLLDNQNIPTTVTGKTFWDERYEDINNMEKHLVRNGTIILKFFLNLSKDEQRNRFLKRLNDPEKHWKFSTSDLEERKYWDQYRNSFEDMIKNTSTMWAPWYIVPADHKWSMRLIVSQIITESILSLNLSYPEVTLKDQEYLKMAKELLMKEV